MASLKPGTTTQRFASSRQVPTFEQSILARFMEEGHLARHVRRMRVLYHERLEALRESAEKWAGELLRIPSTATGMHVVGWLPEGLDDRDARSRAADLDVSVAPISSFRLESAGRTGLLLGYTGFEIRKIREAMQRLSRVLETLR